MNTPMIVLLVILVVMIAAFVALYFMGKKAQARQDEQRAQMDAVAQQVSMLIIDKKKLKMKESGLPEAVVSAVPWYQKNVKVPVVKAKVGPQMMTLICDAEIYDEIPVKKEVKATVSGLYITKVKGLRGGNVKPEAKKKKSLRTWALNKRKELEAEKNK